LYGETFDYIPQFKLLVACNHLPKIPADDEGAWRRIEAVPFESKFVSHPNPENGHEFLIDEHLSEKMHNWKQTFCCLLLNYYQECRQIEHLQVPKKIMEQTKQYRTQVDDVQQFIDDCLVKDDQSGVTWSAIIEAYNHYKKLDIRTRSKESNVLRSQLVKKYFKVEYSKTITIDESKCWGWHGHRIHIKEDE